MRTVDGSWPTPAIRPFSLLFATVLWGATYMHVTSPETDTGEAVGVVAGVMAAVPIWISDLRSRWRRWWTVSLMGVATSTLVVSVWHLRGGWERGALADLVVGSAGEAAGVFMCGPAVAFVALARGLKLGDAPERYVDASIATWIVLLTVYAAWAWSVV